MLHAVGVESRRIAAERKAEDGVAALSMKRVGVDYRTRPRR